MRLVLKKVCIGLILFYAITMLLWWSLHSWLGDSVWWLALLNSFVPYLFLPIVLLLPICLFCRSWSCWAGVVLPTLVFVGLYGQLFLPGWSAPVATGNIPLTVMTFNVWGGSQSQQTAQVILDNGSPDIVALQELTPEMAEVLLEEVGKEYPYHIFDAQARHRGMGILSRYPLIEIDSSHLANSAWQIQIARIEAESGDFTFYNVHPNATNILIYFEEGLSVADNVQASFELRKQLIESLVADIDQHQGSVIVAGDFNSTDQTEVYQLMRGVLKDAHRTVGWGFGHTFPAYAGSFRGIPIFPRQMRIDMIFYSPEFVPLSSRVGKTYGESDHLPVMVQLIWQE
jgi:endonuclease/exonuclease/phosphatase (EEP) superfamily protein YafD